MQCSIICLLRPACFVHPLRRAHLVAGPLTQSLTREKEHDQVSYQQAVLNHSALRWRLTTYLLAGLGLGVGPMDGTPPLAAEDKVPTGGRVLVVTGAGGGPGPLDEGL